MIRQSLYIRTGKHKGKVWPRETTNIKGSYSTFCLVGNIEHTQVVMAKHKPIQEFYAYFVDNLKVDKLLHYLKEKKWLTLDESETLNSGQLTSRQRAEKILLLMPRKTTASFKAEEILVECAIWSGQSELAKKLGYTDSEIAEISQRNPSPTMAVNDGMI